MNLDNRLDEEFNTNNMIIYTHMWDFEVPNLEFLCLLERWSRFVDWTIRVSRNVLECQFCKHFFGLGYCLHYYILLKVEH